LIKEEQQPSTTVPSIITTLIKEELLMLIKKEQQPSTIVPSTLTQHIGEDLFMLIKEQQSSTAVSSIITKLSKEELSMFQEE
jgi:hypothetical protein